MSFEIIKASVDGIPLIYADPGPAEKRKLVIWLPWFSGHKEAVEPQLLELAAAGYVALSFDPWQHGERTPETKDELRARVHSNIRRHFWPILAQTSAEVTRVLDWAIENLDVSPQAGIGGISMGGDISVAAAGLDQRLVAVAAAIATADWLRPGSHEPPGKPDSYARLCFTAGNPLSHLGRYAHAPAISFQSGANDTQVPPDGGQRFVAALQGLYPESAEKFEVVLQPDTPHQYTPEMWQNCLAWFDKWIP